MDRIERLMKDAKPRVQAPSVRPGAASPTSLVFSGHPDVLRRTPHTPARRTPLRAAGAVVLAAAVVVGAVIVGGNLLPEPAPGPAQSAVPTATDTASPSPSIPASATAAPTTSSAGAAAGVLSTGGVECTPANIDQQWNDQVRAIRPIPANEQAYYTVLGCADGWLAYSISDEGARALQLDGGNAWYQIARLQNGRFLADFQQEWSSVFNWKSQAMNNQGLTPQQAMDKQFAANGIPVDLRVQLVGEGPAAG